MNTNNPQEPRIELRDYDVLIPTTDGLGVAERITVQVPMEWDDELKEWLITEEAEQLLESTKARYMGLVLPADLFAMRERLNLTQSEMGELLGIGEKTWTRWETGRQRPSQSLNLLLRAVQANLLSAYDLRWLREPRIDWSSIMKERTVAPHHAVLAMDVAWRISNQPSGPRVDAVIMEFTAA